ncbi:MAG: ATP-dependent DNA helicase RecG [Selenomonadaceae bacterium]|nr:ATP-dependent DNA helicase RecG [Selenomonadaceae bacterium]
MSKTEFEFTDDVKYLKGVGPTKAKSLSKINISNMYDLLTHYPRAYEDWSNITPIINLLDNESVVIVGTLSRPEKIITRTGLTIIKATLDDGTGKISLNWFNQDYLMTKLREGMRLVVIGKVKVEGLFGNATMSQIKSFSILDEGEVPQLGVMPIYPSTGTLTQGFFRTAIKNLLNKMPTLKEILPQDLLDELQLISLDTAARAIHFPADRIQLDEARRRLAFDELFLIQCGLMMIKRQATEESLGVAHKKNGNLVKQVLEGLPFKLTKDQKKTFAAVAKDMESETPMRRLIQGDVGSGKTAVAMLALVKAVENGYQGAFMAPTEILAAQHYEKFSKQLTGLGIRIGLLSSKVTASKKKKEEIYKKIAEHEVDILIGTHAIIQEGVTFANLGLVVTDEQHRFGVSQRSSLEKKSAILPDMLVMTATPIPRTMVLTVYGDLDVSLIKELPPGRKPVQTFVRGVKSREKVYSFVHDEILKGRQAYVVCPLIERSESEKLSNVDPATEMYEMFRLGTFRDVNCALLHGKMKPREKDEIMEKFRAGEIDLLVSTTVVEVGVDVPNATVMVVENAERFGLAQLHQLRGRVGRGAESSYCILISDGKAEHSKERLNAMKTISDGFKLADIDLKLRGPGQFFGEAQHGLPDLKIADVFRDVEILVAANDAAKKFIDDEKKLEYFAALKKNLALAYGDKFQQITEA